MLSKPTKPHSDAGRASFINKNPENTNSTFDDNVDSFFCSQVFAFFSSNHKN